MPVITTNYAALVAVTFLNNNSQAEGSGIAKLASGSRIVMASDDAAGLAIGSQLQSNATVYQQDTTNVAQGLSIMQSSDGALAQISNTLQRMMALATEAASGQVTDIQRAQDINTEYQRLRSEISSIVSSTTYAGQELLSGSFLGNTKYLVGTSSTATLAVKGPTVTASTLIAPSGSTVATEAAALTAMQVVSSAINTVGADRASLGAYESEFTFASHTIFPNEQNISASASVMLDADVAQVKTQLSSEDVKTQSAVASLSQASMLPQELLRLIQS
jgi:flagellin